MSNRKVNTKQDFVDDGVSWNTVTENDNYLPVQYYDARRRTGELDPEKRLILAMLEQAVTDYQQGSKHDRETCVFCKGYYEGDRIKPCRYGALYWHAYDFIFTDVAEPLPVFSFPWVCQALSIEPDLMRKGLENWRTSRRAPVMRTGVAA